MTDLDDALLLAHQARDTPALVALYRAAGEQALKTDESQGCFYLTHAYVFALESGSKQAGELHQILKQLGREE